MRHIVIIIYKKNQGGTAMIGIIGAMEEEVTALKNEMENVETSQ